MKHPMLGEHCYFINDSKVCNGRIIQIEGFISTEKGKLVNIQSNIGDLWIGYYHTHNTKEQALDYLRRSNNEICN